MILWYDFSIININLTYFISALYSLSRKDWAILPIILFLAACDFILNLSTLNRLCLVSGIDITYLLQFLYFICMTELMCIKNEFTYIIIYVLYLKFIFSFQPVFCVTTISTAHPLYIHSAPSLYATIKS